MTAPGDPIEDYLDELLLQLRGRTRSVRRILAETEDHLREASQQAVSSGLSETEAQRVAIARFGSPRTVARRFARGILGPPPSVTLRALVHTAAYLVTVGLLAIGVSGLLSEGFGRAFGADMVAGDIPLPVATYPVRGVTYTEGECDSVQKHAPKGYECRQAAAWLHWRETVEYRLAAGALGGVVGAGLVWWSRRRARRGEAAPAIVLPDGFVSTIAVSLFGTAAAVLLLAAYARGLGHDGRGTGSGQYLSGGVAALAVFAFFGYRLYRTLSMRADTVTALRNESSK